MAMLFPIIASAYTPQKEALLVGIEEYQNGDRLPGIHLDINRMKKVLTKRGFHVKVLFNQSATLRNVTNALKSYSRLRADDSFLFYDSTHGTQVPDLNGDERKNGNNDDQDEAYVLYDANNLDDESGLLIDDELERILSTIHAKKMMISDTCHSGTMYKSFSRNAKTKSKKIASNFRFVNKELLMGDVPKVKKMVVFSATEDSEKSIATSTGSLFTEAFADAWESEPNITFEEMREKTTSHIKDICDHSRDMVAYNPTLYSTNRRYVNEPINEFLQVNITINPKRYLVEEYLDELMQRRAVGSLGLSTKSFYNMGEPITMDIDTHGSRGHLYILSSKKSENKIDVLYPNPYYQNRQEQWRGAFRFPDKSKPFSFKATNKTSGLERTVVYAILSQSPIPELEVSRVGYNKFQSIFKNFNGQSSLKNAFKDILIKRKANKIAIAKQVFSVGI